MKKIALTTFALSLLALGSHLAAGEWLIEGKGAFFGPVEDKFRDIYGDGNGRYGAEISYEFCNCIYGWTSVDWFHDSGHSIGQHHRTNINLIPVGLGLKFMASVNCWDFYLGGGALFTHFETEDHSPYVIRESNKWVYGGILKLGTLLNCNCFFLDIFGDYSWLQDAHFHRTDNGKVERHSANINGWAIGLGIGFRFGGCCD